MNDDEDVAYREDSYRNEALFQAVTFHKDKPASADDVVTTARLFYHFLRRNQNDAT